MATVRGVSNAIREMAARNGFDASRAVDKCSASWVLRLAGTSDEALMAAAKLWRKRAMPTLGDLEDLIGQAAADLGTGCTGCKGTGRRTVMRHTLHRGRHAHQELSCACDCDKGRSFVAGGQMAHVDLVDRWKRSENTIDGVVIVDPEPYQRRPLHEWAAARSRADARLADIEAGVATTLGRFGAA